MREVRPGESTKLFKGSGSEPRAAGRACRTQTAPSHRKDHRKSVTLKTKAFTRKIGC